MSEEVRAPEAAEDWGPEFDALFAADVKLKPIRFTVGGHKCELVPRRMDGPTRQRYLSIGQRMQVTGNKVETTTNFEMDPEKQGLFLVSHTITSGYLFRQKKALNSDGEAVWEQVNVPVLADGREGFWRQQRLDAPFWDWLVEQCRTANGLETVQLKNSESSSAS